MSKLNRLIENLCPNGVESKPLEDILKIKNGSDYKSFGKGDIPVYGSGGIMTYIDHYAYDKPSVLIPRKGSIDKLYYVDTPFWNVDTIFYTEIFTDIVEPRYVYHCLLQEHLEQYNTSGGVPSLTQKVLNKLRVPVPPLEVQREIVRVLDHFTLLTAELTAELQLRKKQYEFYRDQLLSFDAIGGATPRIRLEDVACYSPDRIGANEVNDKTYVGVDNLLQNKLGKTVSHAVPKQGNLTKYIEEDILLGNIRPYLKKIWYATNSGGTNGDVLDIRVKEKDKLLPKYLYYVLSSDRFFNYDNSHSKGTKMPRGDKSAVMDFQFHIPTIDKQQKVVDILDKFNKLANDISVGLPAEIEARQKQYEYYRDKLLNFEEKH